MKIVSAAALALLLTATPVLAQTGLEMPASMPAPKLSASQMDAIKTQLDASPRTPGRAAMMAKLLKLAMAMKAGKPVPTEDLLSLVGFLRESNAAQGNSNPAFGAALSQMETSIMQLQGAGDNADMQELKKEFEGY